MRNHLEDVAKYDVALCPLNVIMCTTSRYLVLPSNLGFRTSSLFIEIQIRSNDNQMNSKYKIKCREYQNGYT